MRNTENVHLLVLKSVCHSSPHFYKALSQNRAACSHHLQLLIVRYLMVSTTKSLTFDLTDINGPDGDIDEKKCGNNEKKKNKKERNIGCGRFQSLAITGRKQCYYI